MTVAELIAALSVLPQDVNIYHDDGDLFRTPAISSFDPDPDTWDDEESKGGILLQFVEGWGMAKYD